MSSFIKPLFRLLSIPLIAAGVVLPGFAATGFNMRGYKVEDTALWGGPVTTGWTTGNLGNTWGEGEWVPYMLILSNVQDNYPGLTGLDLHVSYDFSKSMGGESVRWIDLVRGIQVGTTELNNAQGYPDELGMAMPIAEREDAELAQNIPDEHVWSGFQLLELPDEQINVDMDGGLGLVDSPRHKFVILPADLIAAGVSTEAQTIVIYFQLHESRTFVWGSTLQVYYCEPADIGDPDPQTSDWGGWIYCHEPFRNDQQLGSSYVPGSSGHTQVEDVEITPAPIPVPIEPLCQVYGLKWLDANSNAAFDPYEQTIADWDIGIEGVLEGVVLRRAVPTDQAGCYVFQSLTIGTWVVFEAAVWGRDTGWLETCPYEGAVLNDFVRAVLVAEPEAADWGWQVDFPHDVLTQQNVNFGNVEYQISAPEATATATGLSLSMPCPNPAHDRTAIPFTLPERSRVRVVLCDVTGRQVSVLLEQTLPAGRHAAIWDLSAGVTVPTGIYLCSLEATGLETGKMERATGHVIVLR